MPIGLTVNRRSKSRTTQRRGYVMVLLAMLLFGIMAMAALVIDIGFARLTQRQMQTATDAAALEGLRFRDQLPPSSQLQDLEEARRLQASTVVAQLFDDNLLADETDAINFGAGPIVEFSSSVGDPSIYASQNIQIPETPVYKPERTVGTRGLNINLGNSIEGDMVAGDRFDPTADHSEDNSYNRSDFIPNGSANDVFLVRMRRTGEDFAEGVGTAGPTLPYLFGRGSFINRQLIGDGIKVRATSIAQAEPVLRVGEASPTMIGKLGIAVSTSDWLTPSTPTYFEAPLGIVGESIGPSTTSLPTEAGYLAIFSPIANNRVVGFGYASVTNGTLTKLYFGSGPNQIAYENASASIGQLDGVTVQELEVVFSERRLLNDQNQLLLAPALVR